MTERKLTRLQIKRLATLEGWCSELLQTLYARYDVVRLGPATDDAAQALGQLCKMMGAVEAVRTSTRWVITEGDSRSAVHAIRGAGVVRDGIVRALPLLLAEGSA